MNDELKARIEAIKESCCQTLALAEKATPGPWTVDEKGDIMSREPGVSIHSVIDYVGISSNDATFIAHARNTSPKQARALLTCINVLEHLAFEVEDSDSQEDAMASLESIAREWEESK